MTFTLLSKAAISFWLAVESKKDCIWAFSVSSYSKMHKRPQIKESFVTYLCLAYDAKKE